jgi:CheY-like chemotaxis protein
MSKRILVVEDEEDNRQIIRDMAASSMGSLLSTFFVISRRARAMTRRDTSPPLSAAMQKVPLS